MPGDKTEPAVRHLVYEKVIGESGIWIAESDASEPRLLAPNGERPVKSPDGKWVAYTVGKSSYVVPTTVGKPRAISDGVTRGITWSPDSERIVASGRSGTLVSIDVTGRRNLALLDRSTMSGHSRRTTP
jgi:Tol biopolymer transport system component